MDERQYPPQHAVPPCAHEVMRRLVPEFDRAISRTVHQMRASPDWNEARTLAPSCLIDREPVQELLSAYGQREMKAGATRGEAVQAAEFLGNYTFPLLNFELHRRKLFWVDPLLAWMLLQTHLDIEGRALKLPFPSFAFVFTDGDSLELARALLANDADPSVAARQAFVLCVYVTRVEATGEATGLNLSFFIDGRDGRWPFLVGRDLLVQPGDRLDAILDSHFFESTAARDPIFSSPELKRLVHLVVNAILYSTSLPLPLPARESPLRKVQRSTQGRDEKKRGRAATRLAELAGQYSSEDLFFLPGRIAISQLRQLQDLERAEAGQGCAVRMTR